MARMIRKASLLLAVATTATAQLTGSDLGPSASPPARGHSVEVLDATNGKLYIHAGKSSSAKLDDLWAYDLSANSWTELTPTSATKPSARESHVAAMDATNGKLLIHAGSDSSGKLDDLWAYDISANSWTELTPTSATKPSAREHHVAAMDATNGKLYIHGGKGSAAELDDLWAYDISANSWTALTPTGTKPSAREKHVAAMDTSNGKLYIHAGSGSSGALDDIWVYDISANSWTGLTPTGTKPSARYEHVAAMDTFKGRILIHGGDGATGPLDDIHRYDLVGNSWSVLNPSGTKPSARHSHVAAVADGSRLLVFGGVTGPGEVASDTWQFAWVTSTSTTTTTTTITNTTTVTATTTIAAANTTTVTAASTTTAMTETSMSTVCAPSLFFPLFCVASLATM